MPTRTTDPGGQKADPEVTERYERVAMLLAGPTSPEVEPADLSALEPVDAATLAKTALTSPSTVSADDLARHLGFTP